MRKDRGLTFITVLVVLAIAAGIFWIVTFGGAYYENLEVKHLLQQAGNMCYLEKDDGVVKRFVFRKLHEMFDEQVEDHGRIVTVMRIDTDPDDLRIERSQVPPLVHIWLTYNRTVKIPIAGGTRTMQFVDHIEQDLSPVKW
jgi:hypothetical protein